MSDEAYAIFCLSHLPGLGYATIQKLLVEYQTYPGILKNYHQWQKSPPLSLTWIIFKSQCSS